MPSRRNLFKKKKKERKKSCVKEQLVKWWRLVCKQCVLFVPVRLVGFCDSDYDRNPGMAHMFSVPPRRIITNNNERPLLYKLKIVGLILTAPDMSVS